MMKMTPEDVAKDVMTKMYFVPAGKVDHTGHAYPVDRFVVPMRNDPYGIGFNDVVRVADIIYQSKKNPVMKVKGFVAWVSHMAFRGADGSVHEVRANFRSTTMKRYK
jgi:hypothetical protein